MAEEGKHTLNGTQTAITSGTFEQQWGLDATGNWKTFKQDNDGNGTWELNQTRTTNKANEITGITNSVGAAWATPTYDPAGNMAGIPNPQLLSAQYDAWNRMVRITDGATTICENVYDARGYRIRKDTYTSGTLTEARHYYYSPGWQCVEERVGTSTTLERQFVWGLRYIDDLILRDRSTANNGVINERRYALQDGNWNAIAICDITGFVSERYAYSAYGTPVFMTGAGAVQTSSAVGFETLYAGYRWDGATPQMYYVRNRFLLPIIGTWNKRDPLGYVDGMSLYENSQIVTATDPTGQKCEVGLHCYKVVRGVAIHCGLTVDTDRPLPIHLKRLNPPFWIDGGPDKDPVKNIGEIVVVSTEPQGIGGTVNGPGPIPRGEYIEHPRTSYPQSVCDCLFKEARKLHDLKIGYDPVPKGSETNSNFIAHCLFTRCGLKQSIPIVTGGIGWDAAPPCLEWYPATYEISCSGASFTPGHCKRRLDCSVLPEFQVPGPDPRFIPGPDPPDFDYFEKYINKGPNAIKF